MDPQWLVWAKRLQAIAQTGLTYAKDPFDIERYASIRSVAAEMMAASWGTKCGFFCQTPQYGRWVRNT